MGFRLSAHDDLEVFIGGLQIGKGDDVVHGLVSYWAVMFSKHHVLTFNILMQGGLSCQQFVQIFFVQILDRLFSCSCRGIMGHGTAKS